MEANDEAYFQDYQLLTDDNFFLIALWCSLISETNPTPDILVLRHRVYQERYKLRLFSEPFLGQSVNNWAKNDVKLDMPLMIKYIHSNKQQDP